MLHEAFAPYRVHPKREFFNINPNQAKAILKHFNRKDITEEVNREINNDLTGEDKAARENHRQIYEDVRSGQKYMLDLSAYDEAEWEKLALMGLMERNLFGLKSAGRKSKGIKIFLFIIAAALLSILAILLLFVLQKM